MPMKTLDQICTECQTDKASFYVLPELGPANRGHDYARHYEKFFEPRRNDPIRLIEIGVGGGQSVKAWLEYFAIGKVWGVDIVSNTNPWNTPDSGIDSGYTFVQGDQSSKDFWDGFLAKHGTDWDIIIDDGGHTSSQVLTTYESLWPVLKPGGLYCIEDLGVAFSTGSVFLPDGWPNHMDLIHRTSASVHMGIGPEFVYQSKELAIFQKSS